MIESKSACILVRLAITHDGEDKDSNIEGTDAEQLKIVSRPQSIKGKAGQVEVANNEQTKVYWYDI